MNLPFIPSVAAAEHLELTPAGVRAGFDTGPSGL